MVNQPSIFSHIGWVDYTKGILIVCIVLGHVLDGVNKADIGPDGIVSEYIRNLLYTFHVPGFFFVAGYFARGSIQRGLRLFILEKLRRIAYLYLVWSIIIGLSKTTMSQFTNTKMASDWMIRMLYDPCVPGMWFLYTLFMIQLLFGLFSRYGVGSTRFFFIATTIFFLSCFGWLEAWPVLKMVSRYSIYFSLGIVSVGPLEKLYRKRASTDFLAYSVLGIAVLSILLCFGADRNQFLSPILAFLGISTTIAAAMLLDRNGNFPWFQRLGILSLQIYVAHLLFTVSTRIILQRLFNVQYALVHVVVGTAIGLLLPVMLNSACERIRFTWLFQFPPRQAQFRVRK